MICGWFGSDPLTLSLPIQLFTLDFLVLIL